MKWPFITRKQYDLKVEELSARILDLEHHFVTKRDEHGKVIETLADVPLEKRKDKRQSLKGLTWMQRRNILEETDGFRRVS